MAWELVKEVLNHAPPMTASERLILLAIAEETRKPGQSWNIGTEDMKRMTGGLAPSTVRDALTRLAERGIEVRVPLPDGAGRPLYGKDGRPLYSVPGRVPSYRLPRFPAPEGCDCKPCKEASSGKATVDRRLDEEPQVREGAGTPSPSEGDGRPAAGDGRASPGDGVPAAGDGVPAPMPCHRRDVVPPYAMPDDAAATLRAATPPGENQNPNPATAQASPTLSITAREEIAAARARLRPVGAPASRWTPFRATATEPKDAASNPHYDPAAAAKAREMAEAVPDSLIDQAEGS